MNGRCAHCPVAADVPCLGITDRFPEFCELAASGDPVKRSHVVNRSQIAKDGPLPKSHCAEPNPKLRRQKLLIEMVKLCIYREPTTSCGCGVSKCHAARGSSRIDPQAANMQDCLDCMSAMATDAPANPPTGS